jgi:hypothetical protein
MGHAGESAKDGDKGTRMEGGEVSSEVVKEDVRRLGGSDRRGPSSKELRKQEKREKGVLRRSHTQKKRKDWMDASEEKEQIKELGDENNKGDAWPMATRHVT